jgi:hypothetical protein
VVTDAARHLTPSFGATFTEQVQVVGLTLRREAAILLALLAVVTLLVFLEARETSETIDFEPDGMLLVAAVGLLLPFGVWKGDRLFDAAYLWTLPVDRRRHALTKALAGGVWLLAATVIFMAWLLALMLLTGGGIGSEETRLVLTGPLTNAPLPPEALRPVGWTTQPWEWVTPFTAGPVAYVLGSAWRLGLKHPLRWAAGLFLAFLAVTLFSNEFFSTNVFERAANAVIGGPLGLDAALSGGGDTLAAEVKRASGETVVAWSQLPTFERWAGAIAFWAAIGAAALGAALFRHREN